MKRPRSAGRRAETVRAERVSTSRDDGAADPITHPAFVAAASVAAIAALVSCSYRLHDTDLWQLLVVGKAIWTNGLPTTDQWQWPSYGDPQVVSSWAFRALLWPVWSAGGVGALFVLRWALVLATFGFAWKAARAAGARGFVPLIVIVWASLVYRLRAELRPETAAGVLLAIELWILERRRSGGPDRSAWIVPLAMVWANLHVSYTLGFVVLAAYLADDLWGAARGGSPRRLARVALFAAAACFVNPYGLKLLAQPFEFALRWRNDPMFRNIAELHPPVWSLHLKSGLPLLIVLWPLLLLARLRRHGPDVAGLVMAAAFVAFAVSSQRFIGFLAIAALPFVARDLSGIAGTIRRPATLSGPWPRAAATIGVCVAIGIPEWSRPELPLGIALEPLYPAAACDFMVREGIQGRGFNHFHLGGYLAYRSWPARERLPFATTQPENIRPRDRARYPAVFVDPDAWRALDAEYHFEWAMLAREQDPGDRLLDILDADSSWALAFTDDVVQLLVRRNEDEQDVARRLAYRTLPAGIRRRMEVVPRAVTDTVFRSEVARELERAVQSSPENGHAHHLLGILAMMDGRGRAALDHFGRALAKQPFLPRVHELRGLALLDQGRPRDALRDFERERDLQRRPPGIDLRIGQAWRRLGNPARARRAYEEELRRHPDNAEARDSLAALGAR